MIVAVEGLDGVGKTTFSRILAEYIGATYARLPPPELLLASTSLFAMHDSLARYLYYLSGVASIADTARTSSLLVADRFIASAHALHVHVQGEIADYLRGLPFPSPDVTFYLHATEPVRRTRLELRGSPLDPFEQRLETDASFRQRVSETLQSYPRTYVLDTTGSRPEAVARVAKEIWTATMNGGRNVTVEL
jgi:thymidylate kinase